MNLRCFLFAVLLSLPLRAAVPVDAYISTGDNHWLGSSLPIDSPRSIEDTMTFLQEVCGVKRVYWRGLEEATWIQTMEERPENPRYYSFWQWIRQLYRDVDPDRLAAQAAKRRGMEFWGVGTLFDWGASADTPGFGDYPANAESRLRLQHPEWVPVDRQGFRRQGGPIELAYPEARRALTDLHAAEMRRVGYQGLVFLTYVENYSLRFQDEFGFSPPILEVFEKRHRQDPRQPWTRNASRDDWLRLRGEFVTDYLRELKTALSAQGQKLGVFVDPHDIRQPQPWNVPELMRTAGAMHLDLDTWVREGVVDLLAVYGSCAPSLQDAALRDCRWLVRDTSVQVTVTTSSPHAERWTPLRADGIRTIAALNEDVHFAARSAVPPQTVEALTSGDLARICKALTQIIEGELQAPAESILPLAKEGNLVQRRLALQALAVVKGEAALTTIEQALEDPENGIRCMAAQMLAKVNGPQSVAALLRALERHGNHPLRETAATTLLRLKPFPREPLREAALSSPSVDVRIVATRVLAQQPTAADVPAFEAQLTKWDPYPRFLATEGLGRIRQDEAVVRRLIQLLGHVEVVIATRAATSLAYMATSKNPALEPHRSAVLAALQARFMSYVTDSLRPDADWGYRVIGNALLDFGEEGRRWLESLVAKPHADATLRRNAFAVCYLRQGPARFHEVTEKENAAAFEHLPPAPPPPRAPTVLQVDPRTGSDSNGLAGPLKTLAAAVRLARPGDTIRLAPVVFKESLVLHDRSGRHGLPIIVDGQGATLDGSEELDLADWEALGGDLYRKSGLVPKMDAATLSRWYLLFDGRMQRMGRCSKGPSQPLKKPDALALNEWTYEQAEDAFYVRIRPGTRLAAPLRSSGVAISGRCRHLQIRNLTCTHVYNDGFNIHGFCRDVSFHNIRAVECGDDGVSAHDDCSITVDGLVSEGNATGITDTNASVSHYRNITIRNCDGYDLYFIGSSEHSVTNATIHSRAVRAVVVDGSREKDGVCSLKLENVKLLREGAVQEIRINPNSRLEMRKVESHGLNLVATGGDILALDSRFSGPPEVAFTLWSGVTWVGDRNHFEVSSIRHGNDWFRAADLETFRQRFKSDAASTWK